MISEYFSAAGPRLSFKVAVSSPPGAKHAGFRKRENHAFEADETVWCKVLCKVPYVLEVKTKGFDRVPTEVYVVRCQYSTFTSILLPMYHRR